MNEEHKNHGLKKVKITKEHWVRGRVGILSSKRHWRLGQAVLNPSGQWDAYLPPDQFQSKNGIETNSCATEGTIHAVKTLANFLKLDISTVEYCDRFTAITSGTDPNGGNDPHTVAEAVRTIGVIPETELPFDSTITTLAQFYSPKPMTSIFLALGKIWLSLFSFSHQWVFDGIDLPPETKNQLIKTALMSSPLGVSLFAWARDANGIYYRPLGANDDHWVTLYGYNEDAQGKILTFKIFDSYDQTHKLIRSDMNFEMCKEYFLSPIIAKQGQKLFSISAIIAFIKAFFSIYKPA